MDADVVARFLGLVDKRGPNECWPWLGFIHPKKLYGKMKIRGKAHLAHRLAFRICHGFDPGRWDVLHSCDNRACCNPRHLRLGTHQENMRDRSLRGRCGILLGESNHQAKLSDAECEQVRCRFDAGDSVAAIHKSYPWLHYRCIWNIAHRVRRARGSGRIGPYASLKKVGESL